MLVDFTKMEGLRNDFIIIDRRGKKLSLGKAEFKQIADRRLGIGCDQILLIGNTSRADVDFSYAVVNGDGSFASHCGNGLRCVALYLRNRNEIGDRASAEIGGSVYHVEVLSENQIKVNMGVPDFLPENIGLFSKSISERYTFSIDGSEVVYGAVSIGNPHAVIEVKSLIDTDVPTIGKKFQSDAGFRNGVNVGFFEFLNDSSITLRVWERGVGDTPACGTGACAAVAVGVQRGILSQAVSVKQQGGDLLIEWDGQKGSNLMMTGTARHVFEGKITL